MKEIQSPIGEKKWFEKDGIIYLPVILHKDSGKKMAEWLLKQNVQLSLYERNLFLSLKMNPKRKKVLKVAIMRGTPWHGMRHLIVYMQNEARRHGLTLPNPLIPQLILEQYTKEDLYLMGFEYIIAMHDDIEEENNPNPYLMAIDCKEENPTLVKYYDEPFFFVNNRDGYLFEVMPA